MEVIAGKVTLRLTSKLGQSARFAEMIMNQLFKRVYPLSFSVVCFQGDLNANPLSFCLDSILMNSFVFVVGRNVTDAKLLGNQNDPKLLRARLTGGNQTQTSNKKLVCYYTNWSQYRTKEGKFLPENIDPHLCTHVIFAFGWMKKNKLSSFDSTDETKNGKKGLYDRITELKLQNPALKVLLAVGKSSHTCQSDTRMSSKSNLVLMRACPFVPVSIKRRMEFRHRTLQIDGEQQVQSTSVHLQCYGILERTQL
jgi:hypothetical protein